MRRQIKKTGGVAQPNLFHMWNAGNRAKPNNAGEMDANGCNIIPQATGVPSEPSREPSTVAPLCHGTDDISVPHLVQHSERHGIEIYDEPGLPVIGYGMEEVKLPLVDVIPGFADEDIVPGRSQPLKPTVTTGRKSGQRISEGSSQSGLFPLFRQQDRHRAGVPNQQHENANDEKGARDSRTRKTRKAATSENRISIRRVASEQGISSIFGTSRGHSSAGPSSQPLSRPKEIKEHTPDTRILGPSVPPPAKGSQEEPIVIESSPIRDLEEHDSLVDISTPTKSHRPPRGEVASGFFAPRKPRSSLATSMHRRKLGEGELAQWPDKDSQHVRGAQRSFSTSSDNLARLSFKHRKEDPSLSVAPSSSHLRLQEPPQHAYDPKYLVEPLNSQPNGHERRDNILRSRTSCPAISRFLTAGGDTMASPWNERWRPRCADEVIGNDESAAYLRDWLVALEIRIYGQGTRGDAEDSSGNRSKVSQGAKRPQIIRSVDKPRKRRKTSDSDEESLGDWITSDEEEEEPTSPAFSYVEDTEELSSDRDSERGGSPWKPKLTRLARRRPPDIGCSNNQANDTPSTVPQPAHDFSGRLTNAILLAGPTGSGKTAAVYACAEELGWEVFEVYPGIGKRNGTSLLSLVGDVGKNHIVNRSSRGYSGTHEKQPSASRMSGRGAGTFKSASQETTFQVFTSFFSQENKTSADSNSANVSGSDHQPADLSAQGNSLSSSAAHIRSSAGAPVSNGRSSTPSLDAGRIGTQQSIILLEEVDILFGEDVNFWPTVVTLIKESRRPVVMTCNDLGLVPLDILPLQTVLAFNSCPLNLAASYLQCMALAEGYAVSEEHVKSLYGRNYHSDVLDKPNELVRTSNCPSTPPDLRHAINSLQFLCQGNPEFNSFDPLLKLNTKDQNVFADSALEELYSWDSIQHPTSDLSTEQEDGQKMLARGLSHLWRISDSLSMTDSCLARKPLANLELHSYSTGPPSDVEPGYPCLEYEPDDPHLQNGIVQYNFDEAIATEATECARRAIGSNAANFGIGLMPGVRTDERRKLTNMEVLLRPSGHFARVSGVLEKIVPVAIRQSVDTLILDYEPWVRSIDRSDMELEAAAVTESERRRAARGGRTTRNSQRIPYQRYFDVEEEYRHVWQASRLTEVSHDITGEECES